jgi:hypothetical protein
VTAADGSVSEAELELRHACIHVLPPIGKQKRYPALDLAILHPGETAEPQGRTRINRKLAADLPITSVDEAVEKLRGYACRWKIELSRKLPKSGCRAEAARLRTAERLTKLIAVFSVIAFSVIAWRCFWTAMIARAAPQGPAAVAPTPAEIDVLDRGVRDRPDPPRVGTLCVHLAKVARLGGYLARTHDPPPGNIIMWRGWSRLADIMTGAELANQRWG